jgi:hypothetical protein
MALVATFLANLGCDKFALDTEWRSGDLRLIAIDTRGQMSLINTSDGSWEGIGPTVFSVGADDKYIVLAQHPSTNATGGFDRSVIHYYVVDRAPWRRGVRGPLSQEQFDGLTASLSLPKFVKTFEDLQ